MKQWLKDFLTKQNILFEENVTAGGNIVIHLVYEPHNCGNLHFTFKEENFVNNVLEYWRNFTLNSELKKSFEATKESKEEFNSEMIRKIQTEDMEKYKFLTNLVPNLLKTEQMNRINEECIAIYKKVFTKYGWEIIEQNRVENLPEKKYVIMTPLFTHNAYEKDFMFRIKESCGFEMKRYNLEFVNGKSGNELNDTEIKEVEQMIKEINKIIYIYREMAQKLKF